MFEQLMVVADRARGEFKELEENNWTKAEIEKYKRGYNNGFFDIVSRLRFEKLLSQTEVSLIEAMFDGELRGMRKNEYKRVD